MTTKEQIKNTGATFTPTQLANFLAEKISDYIVSSKYKVLDPACGEGELLLAMANVLKEHNKRFSLFGFDSNDLYLQFAEEKLTMEGFHNNKLIHQDFLKAIDVTTSKMPTLFDTFDSEVNNAFDIVIANPPY